MQRRLFPIALSLSLVTPLAAPVSAQQVDPYGTTSERIPTCVHTLRDQATGNCVGVSSTPTIDMLYPLGPDFFFDSAGLQLGTPVFLDEPLYGVLVDCRELVVGGGDLQVIHGASVGLYEFVTETPTADLHVKRSESAELLLEADAYGFNQFDHPRIRFSQDGGLVEAYVGYQDGQNDLAVRNLYTGGGMRFDLYSTSTRDWEFRRRTAATTDVEARITQSGNLQLDGGVSSPAADLAEYYPVAGEIEPGDVVAFSGQGLTLERARKGADGRVAGVISTRPAFAMGLSYTDERELGRELEATVVGAGTSALITERSTDPTILHEIEVNRRAPLALSGRIPCKVSTENGPIEPGDLLCVSTIPGHAARAIDSGAVIGTALEALDHGEGTILVLANLGWFSPTADLERDMSHVLAELAHLKRQVAALSKR